MNGVLRPTHQTGRRRDPRGEACEVTHIFDDGEKASQVPDATVGGVYIYFETTMSFEKIKIMLQVPVQVLETKEKKGESQQGSQQGSHR